MLGFALVAKGMTIIGPLLIGVIYICDHEEEGDAEDYWRRKVQLWQHQRRQEETSEFSSR